MTPDNAKPITIHKTEPVRLLYLAAAAVALAERYVHNPAALAALGVLLAAAEFVRSAVTPNAHIEEMTPEQWLDEAIKLNVPDGVVTEPPADQTPGA